MNGLGGGRNERTGLACDLLTAGGMNEIHLWGRVSLASIFPFVGYTFVYIDLALSK
jgi:hypothetical protein